MKIKRKIGEGAFTKAYLLEDGRVYLDSCCPVKQIMGLGWFPSHRLFPELQTIRANAYVMRYYDQPRSLKETLTPRQYRLYKALREASYSCYGSDAFFRIHRAFDNMPGEFYRERLILKEALDACGNIGTNIGFEISPRNVAVQGKMLILLDVFFSKDKLREVRNYD